MTEVFNRIIHVQHTVIPFGPELRIGPVDLTITNEVVMLLLAAALTFFFFRVAAKKTGTIPRGKYVNLWEAMFSFIQDFLVRDFIGPQAIGAWTPFIGTIFFFVLFCNLLGLGPIPGVFTAATAEVSVTLTLALISISVVIVAKILQDGIGGFLKMFVPSGVPAWILPLLVPIEFFSFLAKPFSLFVRLAANMFAGHMVLAVFLAMTIAAVKLSWTILIAPFPFLVVLIMNLFEIFVAFIQAFIFAALTAMYLGQALLEEH